MTPPETLTAAQYREIVAGKRPLPCRGLTAAERAMADARGETFREKGRSAAAFGPRSAQNAGSVVGGGSMGARRGGLPSDVFEVEAPVRIRSENILRRMGWRALAATVKSERAAVTQAMTATPRQRALIQSIAQAPRLTITLTRIAPGLIRDEDNAHGGLKGVRDAVAALLGIDDGDKRLTWKYAQEQRRKTYAVRIEIRET